MPGLPLVRPLGSVQASYMKLFSCKTVKLRQGLSDQVKAPRSRSLASNTALSAEIAGPRQQDEDLYNEALADTISRIAVPATPEPARACQAEQEGQEKQGQGPEQGAGVEAGSDEESRQAGCGTEKTNSTSAMFVNDASSPRPARVFVMLPLDTVNYDGIFRYAASPWFQQALQLLSASGVYGVALDVWWGAVEREPRVYNWTGYKQVLEVIKSTGLKLQVVLSFHACGGNVGDTAQVSLPGWVLKCGESDPDIFYTDRPRDGGPGQRNREYLSVWADDAPALCGRTPMQCYEDFMVSFYQHFWHELGTSIEELVVGCGPCGELRYPSYVEANGWRFPGIGEFQCYDRRALASLAQAAKEAGHPEWGYSGPGDAGCYASGPDETTFFREENGGWSTPYGRFFLNWYSQSLLRHGERLLAAAYQTFGPRLHRPPRLCKQNSLSNVDQASDASTTDMLTMTVTNASSTPGTAGPSKASSFRVDPSGDSLSIQSPQAGAGVVAGSMAAPMGRGGQPGGLGQPGSQQLSAGAEPSQGPFASMAVAMGLYSSTAAGPASIAEDMDIEFSDASLTSAVTMAELQALGADGAPNPSTGGLNTVGSGGVSVGNINLPRSLSAWQQQAANRFKFSSSTIADDPCCPPSVGPGTGQVSGPCAPASSSGMLTGGASAAVVPGGAAAGGNAAMGPGTASLMAAAGNGLFRLDVCNSVSSFTTDYYGAASATSSLPFQDLSALIPDADDASGPLACSTPDTMPGEDMSTAGDAADPATAAGAAVGFGPGLRRGGGGSTVMVARAPSPDDASRDRESAAQVLLQQQLLQQQQQRRRYSQDLTAAAAGVASASPLGSPSVANMSQPQLSLQLPAVQQSGAVFSANSGGGLSLCVKVAGIHWWYKTKGHAAECTAGYYNAGDRDGYQPIADICAKYHASLTLTCVEMCDAQHPPHAMCGPEGLLKQVRLACARSGVPLSGENALPIFLIDGVDTTALDRIVMNTRAMSGKWYGSGAGAGPGSSPLSPTGSAAGPVMGVVMGGPAGATYPLFYHSPSVSSMGGGLGSMGSMGGGMSALGGMASKGPSGAMMMGGVPVQRVLANMEGSRMAYAAQAAAAGLRPDMWSDVTEPLPAMRSFTFLRLGPELLQPGYQMPFLRFMYRMQQQQQQQQQQAMGGMGGSSGMLGGLGGSSGGLVY